MNAIRTLIDHKEIQRFLRFGLVGITGTLLDFALLTLLKEVFHLPTLGANTLSYSAGIINNFIFNRLWTFPEARRSPIATQFAQFAVVSLVGLAINDLLVTWLEAPLGLMFGSQERGYLPAKLAATLVVLVWNFIGNRLWTFREIR
jgi:putative flippase GtrA